MKTVKRFIIAILYIGHTLCITAGDISTKAYLINVPVAGIYQKPNLSSPYYSQKIYGSPVTLVKDHNAEWAIIRTKDNIQNYCLKSHLIPHSKQWTARSSAHRVGSLIGCVYPKPLIQSQTIIRLPYGSPVHILDANAHEDWMRIQLADGSIGWMVKSDVEPAKKLSIPEAIERARMFINIPYIWGGVSSYGIDCSGLSQLIAWQRGYPSMARNAAQQCKDPSLIPVALADVKPGDFIYFERDGNIIHVALCSAPGMMIHAYSRRGISKVVETPIDFLADIVKEARRLPV